MRIGELNTLLEGQRQEPDLGLGLPRKWKPTRAKGWFSIEQLSGTELMAAQQIEARANHRLTGHWCDNIRLGDRLVQTKGDEVLRTFNIVAANNVENKNRELELTCIEVVK